MQRELLSARNSVESKGGGIFSTFPSTFWPIMAVDNLDKMHSHALRVSHMDTGGFHGTFASLNAVQLPSSSSQSKSSRPVSFRSVKSRFPSTEELVAEYVPPLDDADLLAFQDCLFGLVLKYENAFSSQDSSEQLSLRRLLLSAFEAQIPRASQVCLARLEPFKASNKHELIKLCQESLTKLLEAKGEGPPLGIVADCPVFTIYWSHWIEELTAGRPLNWFPVPGGAAFHDWKSGAFPALKKLFAGCGVEDLRKQGRGGLSAGALDAWQQMTNLRTHRRIYDNVAVAFITRSLTRYDLPAPYSMRAAKEFKVHQHICNARLLKPRSKHVVLCLRLLTL